LSIPIRSGAVRFTIRPHLGARQSSRPADALDLLWARLGTRREEASFAKVGSEIRARWGEDEPSAMERDERIERGRSAILEILRDVCERSPELELDWFAVFPAA